MRSRYWARAALFALLLLGIGAIILGWALLGGNPTEKVVKSYPVIIQKRSADNAPLVLFLPEEHTDEEARAVRKLTVELAGLIGIDAVAVEGFVAPPGDPKWVEETAEAAKVLNLRPGDLITHLNPGRYNWAFQGKWSAHGLEAADPKAFVDAALLLDYRLQLAELQDAIKLRGSTPLENRARFEAVPEYFLGRGLKILPAPRIDPSRASLGVDHLKWLRESTAASESVLIEVASRRRNEGMTRTILRIIEQERPRVLLVISGGAHILQDESDQVWQLRGVKTVPLLLAERFDGNIVTIDRRKMRP